MCRCIASKLPDWLVLRVAHICGVPKHVIGAVAIQLVFDLPALDVIPTEDIAQALKVVATFIKEWRGGEERIESLVAGITLFVMLWDAGVEGGASGDEVLSDEERCQRYDRAAEQMDAFCADFENIVAEARAAA